VERDRIYVMERLFEGVHFAVLVRPYVVALEIISKDVHAGGVVYLEVEVTGPDTHRFVRAFDETGW
jgi:hypothetical protein